MATQDVTALYQAIFERSTIGMILLRRKDPEHFTILAVNPIAAVAGRWTFPYDSIVSQNILDVFPGVRDLGLVEIYNRALDTQDDVHLGELVYEDQTVSEGIFDISFIPLDSSHLLLTFQNITKRIYLERKLNRSNEELEQFAYVASHDLQEPLRKVHAFSDLLEEASGEVLNEEGRDYLTRTRDAAQRMQALINDLLEISRVTTRGRPFTAVDLNDVAKEVLSDLEIRLDQVGGQVELGQLPTIEADPIQIHQLLQNLISNGLKYQPDGAIPNVKVYAEGMKDQDRGFCKIMVEDNGIGFDEKHLERIFVLFQRLHRRNVYEGNGLGLAICRKIAQRHGGTITAKSKLGKGSTFIVTLPRKQSKLRLGHE